jgi:predicted ester cyclase
MCMDGKGVALRLFEEAFNRGNLDVIGELVHPDLVYHYPDGDIEGLEGARQLVIAMRSDFPDFHVTTEDVLAEGDKVVVRFTDSGTYEGGEFGAAATGKRVTWTGVDIFRIADGKIIEGWGVGDMLGLMRQLGVYPQGDGAS